MNPSPETPLSKPTPTPTFPPWQKALAVLLVGGGLLMLILFGGRFGRNMLQFRTQGLRPGVSAVEDIRPWMTFEYVAVAYGVPTPYLADALNLADTPENRDTPLGRLAREQRIDGAEFITLTQKAITAYQANPVATGLNEIRPWMTLDYIANAVGIPVTYLLDELGLPANRDMEYRPLRNLGREIREPELENRLRAILEAYNPETDAAPEATP